MSPEIAIGSGRTQIILRGRDAIRAAGWALRFLLVARGVSLAVIGTLAAYTAMQWLLSALMR
jgi:hypothetical protein